MTDLAWLSATDALSMFRSLTLSPVELTQALIDRAEKVDPQVNAFTYKYFEEALEAAKQSEMRYMNGTARPLEGICTAIKDAGHVKGLPTSAGSLIMTDAPQETSSPINQRVLDAGVILHARSATPEYSCAAVTWSHKWGVTRNPWNLKMTSGGSSGGAAASLAAGLSTLATGSDIGGSIRIPASCCGVVGYKPPRGRNPVDPPFNLDFYCHTGPLARNVADVALLQNVMCGPHPDDSTTLPRKGIHLSEDIKGLRIALSHDLGFFEVEHEVNEALSQAAMRFRELGATVNEIKIPWKADVMDAALTHLRMIFGTSIAPETADEWDLLTPYARDFAQKGLAVSPKDFFAALGRAGAMGVELAQAMEGYDLLICPTTAVPALRADYDPGTEPLYINGQAVDPMLGWVMTVPFNMLSTRPAMSVPCGQAKNEIPIGLQIIGNPFDDNTVFCAALAFEQAYKLDPKNIDL